MEILEQAVDGALLVRLVGRLDSNTAAALEEMLPQRVQSEPAIVVDLGGVPYVSSAGLRVLLKSAKAAKAAGARLVLASLSADVFEVFEISGFTAIFTIHPTAEEGVAALA